MNSEMNFRINSFAELGSAKRNLKFEIRDQENEFRNNPVINLVSSFQKGHSFKGSVQSSMASLTIDDYKKAAEKLLRTILMANRKTRKFYIVYFVAKEMIPFTVNRIKEMIKK